MTFEGIRGWSVLSDIAIDNVTVTEGNCSGMTSIPLKVRAISAKLIYYGKQCGRAVSVSDSQSSRPACESRSEHYIYLFLGRPEFKSSATLVNSYDKLEIFVSFVCSAPPALVP